MKNIKIIQFSKVVVVLSWFSQGAFAQESLSRTLNYRPFSVTSPSGTTYNITVNRISENKQVFQGDIVIRNTSSDGRGGAGVRFWDTWASSGRIAIEDYSSHPKAALITQAINHINSRPGIKVCLATKTATDTDFIRFLNVTEGCASPVGKQGGANEIEIGPGCSFGNITHELLHSIGLWHEQSRRDRDTYVTVNTANVSDPALIHNFEKIGWLEGSSLGSYDYGSIMHYPRAAFASPGTETIVPTSSTAVIGQRSAMSSGDISAVNELYSSGAGCPTPTTTTPTVADASRGALMSVDTSNLNISYDVQLVPQRTDMSCWAAGAAMVVGWMDNVSIDPEEIAKGIGYWQQYREGLRPENVDALLYWGLVPVANAPTFNLTQFSMLLRQRGPLWVATAEPGPHIRVITGIRGNGNPDQTVVTINDPWEQGMTTFRSGNRGSTYTETWAEFLRKQNTLVTRESNSMAVYVATP